MACLSTRYSTFPAFASETALATSVATVPDFGFGIKPRGPSKRAYLPSFGMYCGVATKMSKFNSSLSNWLRNSSSPMMSAPAFLAAACSDSGAKTATRTSLPVPCGNATVERMFWSAWRGSTPRRMWISTLASNLTGLVSVANFKASSKLYNLFFSTFFAAS